MTKPHEQQVLDMVRAGTITDVEGQKLIDALRGKPAVWELLFNPFDHLPTKWMWTAGAVIVLAGVVVSLLGIRFDGALDLHQVEIPSTPGLAVFDMANAVLTTATVMWLASLLVARQGRLVDFGLSVAIARFPLVAAGALLHFTLPSPTELIARVTANPPDLGLILLTVGVSLPPLVWFIALLFRGFKTSSGLKGPKVGVAFTIALLASEVVSKLILVAVLKMDIWK
jgi:hypothetical protein